jgi:probable F420-dependent oxidoreductase
VRAARNDPQTRIKKGEIKKTMKIGVVYPQTEYSNDPQAIRDYAQTVEALGFSHVLAYDHVLGANPERPDRLTGPYTHESAFQEPLVLFSFMAGVTQKLEFTTGIIILPQRQTALFAKQAATLDVLSNGRTRLGIALGWNHVEYIALNEDFHNRGQRIEEQVHVLRALWTQPLVNFTGRWHTIPEAGLKPLPVQRPIPIWFGGHAEPVLKRVAEIGDGWMPNYRRIADAQATLERLDEFLEAAGRIRSDIGIEARLMYGDGDVDRWETTLQEWREAGATHMSINTMGAGLNSPEANLSALRRFAENFRLNR